VVLGLAAAAAYTISRFRARRSDFGPTDFLIVACVTAIVAGMAMPLFASAQAATREAALKQTLRTLRSQIELYKVEHDGRVPLLYKGTFPQLTHPTNGEGIPGRPGRDYPYGPYFPQKLPANPMTGISEVVPVETFPPEEPTGTGGWIYHQETGRIGPDVEGHLAD
jgi:general secretion pathway protein G